MLSGKQAGNISEPKDFVKRIESELLAALLIYAVPFLGKRIRNDAATKPPINSGLEGIINSKIRFEDMKELEKLLSANAGKDVKLEKKIEVKRGIISDSIILTRQKGKSERYSDYSISIKYEENPDGEKISLSAKKGKKRVYSAVSSVPKEHKSKAIPYSVKITYESNYAEERLGITYKQQLGSYIKKHVEDKEDMSSRVFLKWLNIMPETMMGGVLGFTYLGENFMARRADLTGRTARMVDIHESIHTPDEYETRVLTSWIMEKVKIRYVK